MGKFALWLIAGLTIISQVQATTIIAVYQENIHSLYQDFQAGVIEGIRLEAMNVEFIPVNETSSVDSIIRVAKKVKANGIIWLGSNGLTLGLKLRSSFPSVFGMTYLSHDEYPYLSGVTIQTIPDPLLKFTRKLLPKHNRLFYVYQPKYEKTYLTSLKKAASKWNFKLILYPAKTPKNAVLTYRSLIHDMDGTKDVLLISTDPRVMAKIFYQEILVNGWKHKIPIIGNSVEYSWAGVMIGAYPDPIAYGKQITKMLLERIKAGKKWRDRIEMAKNVRIAFNTKYSQALGIELPLGLKKIVSRLLIW